MKFLVKNILLLIIILLLINSATVSDVDNLAGVSDNCRPTDLSELPSASYTTTAEESDVTVNVSQSA